MANALTFSVPAQARQAGTYEVPAAAPYPKLPAGYSVAELDLNVANADYENTANHITYMVYVSRDGVSWSLAAQADWSGGRKTSRSGVVDPPQVLSVGISGWVGWYVKGAVTLNNPCLWASH
jgi:hypothetical protein